MFEVLVAVEAGHVREDEEEREGMVAGMGEVLLLVNVDDTLEGQKED